MTDLNTEKDQPGLFDSPAASYETNALVRFALGEFQERGFQLAGRRLALDRLLGAFRRAFEEFGVEPLNDSDIAKALKHAGATIVDVPEYVAKHPYRVLVGEDLAFESREYFKSRKTNRKP